MESSKIKQKMNNRPLIFIMGGVACRLMEYIYNIEF